MLILKDWMNFTYQEPFSLERQDALDWKNVAV